MSEEVSPTETAALPVENEETTTSTAEPTSQVVAPVEEAKPPAIREEQPNEDDNKVDESPKEAEVPPPADADKKSKDEQDSEQRQAADTTGEAAVTGNDDANNNTPVDAQGGEKTAPSEERVSETATEDVQEADAEQKEEANQPDEVATAEQTDDGEQQPKEGEKEEEAPSAADQDKEEQEVNDAAAEGKKEEEEVEEEQKAKSAADDHDSDGNDDVKEEKKEQPKPATPAPPAKKRKAATARKPARKARKGPHQVNPKLLGSTQSIASQFVASRHLTMRTAMSRSARGQRVVDGVDITKIRLDPWRKEVKPFKRNLKAPNPEWLEAHAKPLQRRSIKKWEESKPPPPDYHSRPVGVQELPPLKQHIQEHVQNLSKPRIVTAKWNPENYKPKPAARRTDSSGDTLRNQEWFVNHSKPLRPSERFKPDPRPDYTKGLHLRPKNKEAIERLAQLPKHWQNAKK